MENENEQRFISIPKTNWLFYAKKNSNSTLITQKHGIMVKVTHEGFLLRSLIFLQHPVT